VVLALAGRNRVVQAGDDREEENRLAKLLYVDNEEASKLRLVGGRIRYEGPKDWWMDGDGFIK
jgi:hypothetical protein